MRAQRNFSIMKSELGFFAMLRMTIKESTLHNQHQNYTNYGYDGGKDAKLALGQYFHHINTQNGSDNHKRNGTRINSECGEVDIMPREYL